jgi:hypothetical protein
LSATTNRLFEREANQGAAELLFQRDRFSRDAGDLEVSIAAIWNLAQRYGSSFHAAVRHYAETHPGAVAAIVLERTPCRSDPPTWRREEAMATSRWSERFGKPTWPQRMNVHAYPFLTALDIAALTDVTFTDVMGAPTQVKVEAYQTPYKSFVLLWVPPNRRGLRPPPRKVLLGAGIE